MLTSVFLTTDTNTPMLNPLFVVVFGEENLSFWGKICLIKSVLSSILLYYFSFFKVRMKVLLLPNKIQQNFLWGVKSEEKK